MQSLFSILARSNTHTSSNPAVNHNMGRKKGKQSGDFHCKKLNAEHLHKIYVDNASEANQYRNQVSNVLGRGQGYRASAPTNESIGRWDSNGRSCNGDKWSSIFANRSFKRSSSLPRSRHDQNAARGLAHLRHLLEDRRTEDRFHDRQFRLAVQRSKIRDSGLGHRNVNRAGAKSDGETGQGSSAKRNEAGWLISHSFDADKCADRQSRVPSLQILAAQVLGPLLPMYVAACGHDFIGDCLKPVSPEVLAQLSISLAKSSFEADDDEATFSTTDGVVKALVHSGVATGLVLKGAPLVSTTYFDCNEEHEYVNPDTSWLSDDGLLALCPRLLSQVDVTGDSYNDNWETLDVDLDLNRRMAGCLHLSRLELIDIPLHSASSQRGISLGALRHVLQACPGITHLGISGCFYNWTESGPVRNSNDDVSLLLCGTKLISQTSTATDRENEIRKIDGWRNEHGFEDDQLYEIKGLHHLLPELRVLDLSHCEWLTPMMIFRFLIQYREGAARSFDTSKSGGSTKTDYSYVDCTGQNAGVACAVSLKQLAIMGCNFSTEDVRMIEEWIDHSLFGCVKLLSASCF